jgi:hypothetical protein
MPMAMMVPAGLPCTKYGSDSTTMPSLTYSDRLCMTHLTIHSRSLETQFLFERGFLSLSLLSGLSDIRSLNVTRANWLATQFAALIFYMN